MFRDLRSKFNVFLSTTIILIALGVFYPKQAEASFISSIKEMIDQLLMIIDPVVPPALQESVRMANLDSDYEDLGLTKDTIQLWEDGQRISLDEEGPAFEWWYFDGTFDDGSSYVASFYSRMDQLDPTKPYIKLTITTPDGEILARDYWGDHSASSYSTDDCNFNIGADNVVTSANGTTYHIVSAVEDIAVDLVLQRTVHSFRQDTGYILVGNDEDEYLAWFSMVPKGTLSGTITYDGATHTVTGIGYHDHNWGTATIENVTKGWWWMRGYVDDMAIIAYDWSFKNKYGDTHIPIYGVVNSTDVVAVYDDTLKTTITGKDLGFPDVDGYSKLLSDRIPFEIDIKTGTWWDCWRGTDCLQINFYAEELLESIDILSMNDVSDTELIMLKLLSYDPWYTRYSGSVDIELSDFNGWTTSGSGTAIIEYLDME